MFPLENKMIIIKVEQTHSNNNSGISSVKCVVSQKAALKGPEGHMPRVSQLWFRSSIHSDRFHIRCWSPIFCDLRFMQ